MDIVIVGIYNILYIVNFEIIHCNYKWHEKPKWTGKESHSFKDKLFWYEFPNYEIPVMFVYCFRNSKKCLHGTLINNGESYLELCRHLHEPVVGYGLGFLQSRTLGIRLIKPVPVQSLLFTIVWGSPLTCVTDTADAILWLKQGVSLENSEVKKFV